MHYRPKLFICSNLRPQWFSSILNRIIFFKHLKGFFFCCCWNAKIFKNRGYKSARYCQCFSEVTASAFSPCEVINWTHFPALCLQLSYFSLNSFKTHSIFFIGIWQIILLNILSKWPLMASGISVASLYWFHYALAELALASPLKHCLLQECSFSFGFIDRVFLPSC